MTYTADDWQPGAQVVVTKGGTSRDAPEGIRLTVVEKVYPKTGHFTVAAIRDTKFRIGSGEMAGRGSYYRYTVHRPTPALLAEYERRRMLSALAHAHWSQLTNEELTGAYAFLEPLLKTALDRKKASLDRHLGARP